MSLDIKAIRTSLIDSIQLSIGSLLSQQYNPTLDTSYGSVLSARPNPEIAVPEYPYAVLDLLSIQDTDWFITNLVYDTTTGLWQYETHKTIDCQVTIFGSDSLFLGEQLKTSYRRDDMITLLAEAGIAIADVQLVQISPELLQTDFLEVSVIQISIRVNDTYVDPDMESIETVDMEGELEGSLVSDPIIIDIYSPEQSS